MNVKTNQLENGNISFSYSPQKYKRVSQLSIIVIVLAIILCLCEWIYFGSLYTIIAGAIAILYVLYRDARKIDNANEDLEREVIFNSLNPIIENDIKSLTENVLELDRKYVIDCGNYGEILGRYALILLSNGKKLRYDIKSITFNKGVYLEIDTKYKLIGHS